MTTNIEHLRQACRAVLDADTLTPELIDDLGSSLTLVEFAMYEAGVRHMHLWVDVTTLSDVRRFECECGAAREEPVSLLQREDNHE